MVKQLMETHQSNSQALQVASLSNWATYPAGFSVVIMWKCFEKKLGESMQNSQKTPKSTKHVVFFCREGHFEFYKDGNILFHDFLWRLKFECPSDDLKVSNLVPLCWDNSRLSKQKLPEILLPHPPANVFFLNEPRKKPWLLSIESWLVHRDP